MRFKVGSGRVPCALRRLGGGAGGDCARRALCRVVLTVAATLAGGPALAQAAIESVRVTSAPGGGSVTEPVWIVGDPVVLDVRYSSDLRAGATGILRIELDEVGDGRGEFREAACAVDRADARVLACTYRVREGDRGTGVSVEARAGTLTGSDLPNTLFSRRDVTGSTYDVDGVPLAFADGGVTVRVLDEFGQDITGRGGAKAGDVVEVRLAFADGEAPRYSVGFGVTLLLANARREMAYAGDRYGGLDFRYVVAAGDRARKFTLALTGAERLLDASGNAGLATGEDVNASFLPASVRRVDTAGPRITDVRVAGEPETGAYVANDPVNFEVAFDEPVYAAPAAVSLVVRVGSGAGTTSQSALCSLGEGGKELQCALVVREGWEDTDGIGTPAKPLAFGAGDLEDDLGNVAQNRFAAKRFPNHKIDTTPPVIERTTVSTPAARTGETIVVAFMFSEEVIDGSGSLTLSIEDGIQNGAATRVGLSGRSLEFRYTLKASDVDGDVGDTKSITLEGLSGPFHDRHGNRVPPGGVEVEYPSPVTPIQPLRLVAEAGRLDTSFKGIERTYLVNPPLRDRYGLAANKRVSFGVVFREAAKFSGDVEFVFTIDGEERRASRIDGSGTSLWTASYEVQSGDSGRVEVKELRLNPASDVLDLADNGYENPADTAQPRGNVVVRERIGLPSLPRRPVYVVDTEAPTVAGATLLATPAPTLTGTDGQKYYGDGDTIEIQVSMSEDVVVDAMASAHLAIEVDGASGVRAEFLELRGKRHLIYEYVVQPHHIDRDGIAVPALAQSAMGVTVTDLAGNTAQLVHAAVSSAAHRIDGTLTAEVEEDQPPTPPPGEEPETPDRVNAIHRVTDRSDPPPSGFHRAGEEIRIEVTFDPAVTFTRRPELRLEFDRGGDACARLESLEAPGEDVRAVTFVCLVEEGDEDLDGIEATLEGEFTTAEGAEVVTSDFRLADRPKVDALRPVLEGLELTSAGPYTEGDLVEVTATFSEPVSTRGTPGVPLTVGDGIRVATLVPPPGGAAERLVFRYTIVMGDDDGDGIGIPAFRAGGAATDPAFFDAAGNEASIDYAGHEGGDGHRVDTTAPEVVSIIIAGPARTYGRGDVVAVEVAFSELVSIAEAPPVTLWLNVGADTRRLALAPEVGGDGGLLTFMYTVAAGDSGELGVPRNALTGGFADALGNAADLSNASVAFPGHVVDAVATTVASAEIVSDPGADETYGVGDTVTVAVTFDEAVTVTASETGPHLMLTIGERRRVAMYTGGGGTATLRFSYRVQPGDVDTNGVSVDANSLRLAGGSTIVDAGGLPAELGHAAVPAQARHRVDGAAPAVAAVAITSQPEDGDAYFVGETVEVTVQFSEPVTVVHTPVLALTVGTGTRDAGCGRASTDTLRCTYLVAVDDVDENGVAIAADSLTGALVDVAGNPADLSHEALADDPVHRIDAAAPRVETPAAAMGLVAGGDLGTVDLATVFGGARLGYEAASSDTRVATVELAGNVLAVRSGGEGSATVTVTATSRAGSVTASFVVEVATDRAETAVLGDTLASIGRGLLAGTATVIGSRFELVPEGGTTPAAMTLGGRRVAPAVLGHVAERQLARRAAGGWRDERAAANGGGGMDSLAWNSAFSMPLSAAGGVAAFSVWGAGDFRRFEGGSESGHDGSASTGYLGVDARGAGWLAGVSVSRSASSADYAFRGRVAGGGSLDTSITSINPYARVELGGETELWAIAGIGAGEADLSRSHVDEATSGDLSMYLVIAGLKRALDFSYGGAEMAVKADAGVLNLETDGGPRAVNGLTAGVSRVRVGLEAGWTMGMARPFAEMSGRLDGGDGASGGGLEVAGGVRLARGRFGLEAKGRVLALHTADGYGESGISLTARIDPVVGGRGISLRVSPRWGARADGTDLFWHDGGGIGAAGAVRRPTPGARGSAWGVDAGLGYGMGIAGVRGVVTPFGELRVGDGTRQVRVGVRYACAEGLPGTATLEFAGERRDTDRYDVSEGGVFLRAESRF